MIWKMHSPFEQTCDIGLDGTALYGSPSHEDGANLWADVNGDLQGRPFMANPSSFGPQTLPPKGFSFQRAESILEESIPENP
jgi:hypothetical protein